MEISAIKNSISYVFENSSDLLENQITFDGFLQFNNYVFRIEHETKITYKLSHSTDVQSIIFPEICCSFVCFMICAYYV